MKRSSSIQLLNRTLNEVQFSWAVRFLFVISVILIIILSFSYHSINRELIFYSEKVDHTHEVLDKISEIKVEMHEATYYGRGYLIQNDSTNRALMLQKINNLPVLAYQLDTLLIDSGTNVLSKNLIMTVLDYKQRVENFANQPLASLTLAQKDTLLKRGSSKTAQISNLLDKMTRLENKLMENRVQSRNNYKLKVFQFNWVIMGVALAFLVSAFILLERELAQNKKYKIELESKIANLNRSNSELEQFAYVASHDLQEPLRKIRSFTDLLIAKYLPTLTEEGGMMLRKIDKSASRMQLLIDDLLAFSRSIDDSQDPEQVDLNNVLEEVLHNLSESIEKKAVEIYVEPLPLIIGHGSQMVQLFQNLLSNSIKYSKPGLPPKISITCSEVEGSDIPDAKLSQEFKSFYCIVVQDNGIGFKKEYAEKIFVIFKRLHSQEMFQGSGIGLAICRKVISNHNGYISAEGKEGLGAKFYLYLPKQTTLV
jgi:signal transduction histidine kinase